jgi:hypothetical protein
VKRRPICSTKTLELAHCTVSHTNTNHHENAQASQIEDKGNLCWCLHFTSNVMLYACSCTIALVLRHCCCSWILCNVLWWFWCIICRSMAISCPLNCIVWCMFLFSEPVAECVWWNRIVKEILDPERYARGGGGKLNEMSRLPCLSLKWITCVLI